MNNVNISRLPATGIAAEFAGTVSMLRDRKTTQSGKPFQGFTIAVINTVESSDGATTRSVDRINCTAWDAMADVVKDADLTVGKKVKVRGWLKPNTFIDRNGEERQGVDLSVDSLSY